MKNTVFIHTNNKQRLGALVGKHAILSRLKNPSHIDVQFINVDELTIFKNFIGTEYLFSENERRTYTQEDLQSFTLARFMPPQLMGYEGRAIVIDPDIFALCDIEELFSFDLHGAAIAACKKLDAWDTSVMLMDTSKLTHWNIEKILNGLTERSLTYNDIMMLRKESLPIQELPRIWNHLDTYTEETKLLHTTGRLTQPWKTGLPVDFTRNRYRKILGIIPREPIYRLLGKEKGYYQQHPNKNIEDLFFKLLKDALEGNSITTAEIQDAIARKYVRPDILECIA